MMDFESPCQCPRCQWLGKLRDARELTDPVQYICPRCTTETVVQKLGQKGLDGLRQEYELLVKMSYAVHLPPLKKMARRERLERFFEHINKPLKDRTVVVKKARYE